MPFYSYSCASCSKTFKVYHSGDETQNNCIICKSDKLTKVLPTLRNITVKETDTSAKQRIEKFIEESRETLKEQKSEAVRELK